MLYTQQSLSALRVALHRFRKSVFLSRERTFTNMMVGKAGLTGLALSLALTPPRLPRFRDLSQRRRWYLLVEITPSAWDSYSGFWYSTETRDYTYIQLKITLYFLKSRYLQRPPQVLVAPPCCVLACSVLYFLFFLLLLYSFCLFLLVELVARSWWKLGTVVSLTSL